MATPETTSIPYGHQRRVIYHEAGHVVAAVRLDIPFMHVKITRTVDIRGEVEMGVTPLDSEDGYESREEMQRWQQFYAAGAASEKLFFGDYFRHSCSKDCRIHEAYEKRSHSPRFDGWEQDIAIAAAILDRFYPLVSVYANSG